MDTDIVSGDMWCSVSLLCLCSAMKQMDPYTLTPSASVSLITIIMLNLFPRQLEMLRLCKRVKVISGCLLSLCSLKSYQTTNKPLYLQSVYNKKLTDSVVYNCSWGIFDYLSTKWHTNHVICYVVLVIYRSKVMCITLNLHVSLMISSVLKCFCTEYLCRSGSDILVKVLMMLYNDSAYTPLSFLFCWKPEFVLKKSKAIKQVFCICHCCT